MSQGELFDYAQARNIAVCIKQVLEPACHEIEIAGSVRRGKDQVHDIDLVLWPVCEEVALPQLDFFHPNLRTLPIRLYTLLEQVYGVVVKRDEYHLRIVFQARHAGVIPVDLYLAQPDGCNFAALLQMRTGSEAFNISLATRAQRMGLNYHAGYGIFDSDNRRMDDGTEDGVFRCLGLPEIAVNHRERSYQEELFSGKGAE